MWARVSRGCGCRTHCSSRPPGCGAQGLCGHLEPAFRAGAGGDGEGGEGSDECGLEAQEEGGSGGSTRTPAGRPSGGPRFQLGTSLGSVGPRLLPSMLTSSPGRWRPAVVSPAAAPAPPPGSANSRPEHGIPFCGGRQDPSPAHTRQSADDLDKGEADRREVEEQRCQHVRVQRPLQPEAVSGNWGPGWQVPTPCVACDRAAGTQLQAGRPGGQGTSPGPTVSSRGRARAVSQSWSH